jgi:hypothetical protein
VPLTVDDDDDVFAGFLEHYPEMEEQLALGDLFKLPGALWAWTMCRLSASLPAALRQAGVALCDPVAVAVQAVDGDELDAGGTAGYEAIMQRNLRQYFKPNDPRLPAFAALCYQDGKRAAALLRLREGKSLRLPVDYHD